MPDSTTGTRCVFICTAFKHQPALGGRRVHCKAIRCGKLANKLSENTNAHKPHRREEAIFPAAAARRCRGEAGWTIRWRECKSEKYNTWGVLMQRERGKWWKERARWGEKRDGWMASWCNGKAEGGCWRREEERGGGGWRRARGFIKVWKKTEEMMEEGKRRKALDQRLIKREREKEDTYSSQIGNQ